MAIITAESRVSTYGLVWAHWPRALRAYSKCPKTLGVGQMLYYILFISQEHVTEQRCGSIFIFHWSLSRNKVLTCSEWNLVQIADVNH